MSKKGNGAKKLVVHNYDTMRLKSGAYVGRVWITK